MKFVTTDFSVRCIRETEKGDEEVASFDINIDQVAPHVAAVLFPTEVEELEAWLRARSELQEHLTERPDELNLIDVLPSLLNEASQVLQEHGKIDLRVKNELKSNIAQLSKELDKLAVISEPKPETIEDLGKAELIKAKLDVIKSCLTDADLD